MAAAPKPQPRGLKFRPERLEQPRGFWEREFSRSLPRANRKGDVSGLPCPFHASRSKKSFTVNIETGRWRCWGCGVHGSSIVSYVMLSRNLTFANAARALNAWEDAALDEKQQAEIAAAHRRLINERNERERYKALEHAVRIAYRDRIHLFDGLLRTMRSALRDPNAARLEIAEVVALTQAELRDAVTGYYIVSFADERERRRFVTEPDARFQMIEETFYRESVRTDDNKVVEPAV